MSAICLRRCPTWFLVVCAVGALPLSAFAQQATILGTVTDSTGGVLPGVTITATHEATGNTFVAVTDEHGAFRLPVRTGVHRISAELPGFSTQVRTLDLLLGQQASVTLQLTPAAVQESVTVTGEAPLIDTSSSTLSGNIDPRQMQELPLNGRNWMDLSLLAPGSRQNQSSEAPLDRQGYWQINVDGQQVTQLLSGGATQQAKYSRDAIAEFEIITNRFDATQGRSAGAVVNAITKSGTNQYAGTVSGYFRDDRFNSDDFIQNRVLPYSNQQVSTTFGGPIRKDRIHFFGSYEYEHEPSTITYSSQWSSFNIDLLNTRQQHTGIGRVDMQFSPQLHFSVRGQKYYQDIPFASAGSASAHPSGNQRNRRYTDQLLGTLTQVLGNRAVNEIKGGYDLNNRINDLNVFWKGGKFPNAVVLNGGPPVITLRGYTIGSASQQAAQNYYSIRDDFNLTYAWHGGHAMKTGSEYIYVIGHINWCTNCQGTIDATGGPVPANVESLFPVWNDASTWNLAALSPITIRYRQAVGNFNYPTPRHLYAGWLQDDWALTPKLTLNLGVRYDFDINGDGENIRIPTWRSGNEPHDLNNVAPRFGFAYKVNDRTVLRGGYGKFFAQLSNDPQHNSMVSALTVIPEVLNDGRPDFASNPFNGPAPTFDQVVAHACDTAFVAGCVRREITNEIPTPNHQTQFSHQASIGVERQVASTMAMQANYVYTGGRLEEADYNMNLTYNPATGANYPFTDISHRRFPEWGVVLGEFMEGWSNYHGLETSFTKRLSHRWQGSATYTLSAFWDTRPNPPSIDFSNGKPVEKPLGFQVVPDLGYEYGLAATDQRHRAVFNGILEAGYGFQVSGVYFFGSGQRLGTTYGANLRDTGVGSSGRLRPDGSIIARNIFVGKPIHRVDLRVQRRFKLATHATFDGVLEAFNLLDHTNYGSYTTNESNRAYGQPASNTNIAYQPRMLQLGFRFAF